MNSQQKSLITDEGEAVGTHNRSSLLVLSSSKEDENEEKVYSLKTNPDIKAEHDCKNNTDEIDPKILIQFKELETESLQLSRLGGNENFAQPKLSSGTDGVENAGQTFQFGKRVVADLNQHLDGLSLDSNGSLHVSTLLQSAGVVVGNLTRSTVAPDTKDVFNGH